MISWPLHPRVGAKTLGNRVGYIYAVEVGLKVPWVGLS